MQWKVVSKWSAGFDVRRHLSRLQSTQPSRARLCNLLQVPGLRVRDTIGERDRKEAASMTTERANDLRAFRDFADAKLSNGGAEMTLDEALSLWEYENSPEHAREE